MSRLIPDIDRKIKDSFYIETRNKAIAPEDTSIKEESLSLQDFKKALKDFAKGFEGEDAKLYKYASLSGKLCSNNRDTLTILNNFNTYLLISLKRTFPDKNFSDFEKSIEILEKDLASIIKNDNVDNNIFFPCILGILEGIL